MNAALPARRLLPSLSDLVFSTTLLFVFLMGDGASRLLDDSDTGWHIRTGEWILEHRAVPSQDLFSFSKPAGDWFAWEWLSDVALAVAHRLAGLPGVALLAAVTIALVFGLLHRWIVSRGANVLVATAVVIAGAYAASIHWLARPHVFGWLLALAFYGVLEASPVNGRRLFWLVPLAMLWANVHGSFVVGLLLVGLYGAGELVRAAVAEAERKEALERAKRYALVLAACAASTLLNPQGLRLHQHVGRYLADSYIQQHISEFFSPNFHAPAARFFEILLLAGAWAAFWAVRRGQYAQAALVIASAHFALVSARHIPLYVVFAAPVIAAALTAAATSWPRAFARFSADVRAIEVTPRWHAAAALAVVLVTALAVSPGRLQPKFSPKTFPVAAADYLEKAAFTGGIFSTDQWSGYLIYRAFPRIRVFVDGRSDYYGPQIGSHYLSLMSVHHTWQETLDRYAIQFVLLPVDSGFAGALKESGRWTVAYDDGVGILFHRASGQPPQLPSVAQNKTFLKETTP